MPFTYEFPRPLGTADIALISPLSNRVEILLIRRGHDPYAGCFALPGGFMEMDEPPQHTAARELQEETCLANIALRPILTCGQPGRDPRGRCLTMVYGALVNAADLAPRGGDDAAEARWFPLEQPPEMAFDHGRVVAQILAHLRWQAATAVIGRDLLPPEFSSDELTALHEKVLGRRLEEAPLDRGVRLGLLKRGSRPDRWRFNLPHTDSGDPQDEGSGLPAPRGRVFGGPDWEPLVW